MHLNEQLTDALSEGGGTVLVEQQQEEIFIVQLLASSIVSNSLSISLFLSLDNSPRPTPDDGHEERMAVEDFV